MIKLLQLLWYGHAHKWKIIDQRNVVGPTLSGENGVVGMRYTCQCEQCGHIKTFNNY